MLEKILFNTENYIGCAIANADSVSMDINDDDNQNVGCAIACAARADFLSNSDSNDISETMTTTVVVRKYVTQLDRNLMVVDRVQYCLSMLQKKIIHQPFQKHAIIYFVILIS